MTWRQINLLSEVLLMITLSAAGAIASPEALSFDYGHGSAPDASGARTHQASIGEVSEQVFVYATFEMGPENPIPYGDLQAKTADEAETPEGYVMPEDQPGKEITATPESSGEQPRGRQFITLGQLKDGEFTPAVRFGIHDGRSLPAYEGMMYAYLRCGQLDCYGLWIRPNTPYDFKLRLDLATQRMTVFVSGRGDDEWYIMAENTPLIKPVTAINQVRVEQWPDAAGISTLMVRDKPWAPAEPIQLHPLAKQQHAGVGRGFRFQSQRSLWQKPGQHVTIARKQGMHFGFPDVAQAADGTLLCVFSNRSHTGGQGGSSICRSTDLGQTWSELQSSPGGGRIRSWHNGTLLLEGPKGQYLVSADAGRTWTDLFSIDAVKAGGNALDVPGHMQELADGSWLIVASSYPGGKAWGGTEGEQLEFYRSTDEGQSWEFVSKLQPYPPHSICEASILVLPEGKLAVYAREDRGDSFPGIKAFSDDNAKTWRVEELPFPITGRTCAKFLSDGRVMVTTRNDTGRSGLWAWIGDLHDTTPFRASGIHFNDRHSVGLKEDGLHIDSDGVRGQFTQYVLRQPDTTDSTIDVTVEVNVVANSGQAATLSVPFVGKFRLFPNRIELARDPQMNATVSPGQFHIYRVVREPGKATVYVDGQLAFEMTQVDERTENPPWTPAKPSIYRLALGNEADSAGPNIFPDQLHAEVTGYSIWRRFELTLDDPNTGRYTSSWSAESGEFPDQYQLDHIIEVGAAAASHDQGYSGWVELDDGRIFVVNYTDDGASTESGKYGGRYGISWIRGTFMLPSDLPPAHH